MKSAIISWDSAIVDLINYQLKNTTFTNGEKLNSPLENQISTSDEYENRSPEEFKAYIEELFQNRNKFNQYQGHFNVRKKRKKRYCGDCY